MAVEGRLSLLVLRETITGERDAEEEDRRRLERLDDRRKMGEGRVAAALGFLFGELAKKKRRGGG